MLLRAKLEGLGGVERKGVQTRSSPATNTPLCLIISCLPPPSPPHVSLADPPKNVTRGGPHAINASQQSADLSAAVGSAPSYASTTCLLRLLELIYLGDKQVDGVVGGWGEALRWSCAVRPGRLTDNANSRVPLTSPHASPLSTAQKTVCLLVG